MCAEALYSLEHSPTSFPRHIFVERREMASFSVEFSFVLR